MNLVNSYSDEYSAQQQQFILSQKELIHIYHLHFGNAAESEKTTLDDKVCAVGIVLTDLQVREVLHDMLGRAMGGHGLQLLRTKLIDREVAVHLPEK